jgi:hypothetical protein
MFRLLSRVYIILSHHGKYIQSRTYSSNNSKFQIMCCNAFKNKCECVYTCKKLEQREYIECAFKCEITNKPKRLGGEDCNCELMCMAKKSETQTIHENSNNANNEN